MMPSAASLARYPAFVNHDQLASATQLYPDQSTNNSSLSSSSSTASFDLPALMNSSFLQSEFQRNIAQFTNQLTMTGQSELLSSNANGNTENSNLQYSDDQLISGAKKINFSIDSLVNSKHSALNKQNAAAALFNGLNGAANLNSIKKENDLSAQNLQNNIAMAAALMLNNRNGNSLQANLAKMNNKDDLRGSPNSRLISPCSSTSSVCSDQKQHHQQTNTNQQHNAPRTSANNSPRPASAASQHSGSQSASQLLNAAQLQNNNASSSSFGANSQPADGNQSSLSNSKINFNKVKAEERSRSPPTASQTANSRSSTSPSFMNNLSNNSSIKESPSSGLVPDVALLQHIQQQQLRQQLQQQLQQVTPDSALLQHIQQQQLRQLQQQQNPPLQSLSPHLQAHHANAANHHQQQSGQSNTSNTPQQTTSQGPPPQTSPFNPTNTAAALLNQLRANSLNGGVPNPVLNPLNGLNLPNQASLASQPNLPNLPPDLGQLGLNAASMNSPLNSLVPSLNPLSPPRPHTMADYASYYQYLTMARTGSYYPMGTNQYMHAFPFIMGMARKPKRVCTAFNPNQLLQLEQAFEKNQYVVGQERKQLANTLQLSETQVKVWFQNRRTKHKRLKTEGEDPSKSPLSDNNDKSCFSGDEEIDDDDTEIDPDGFNNDELKMQQLINSNFNPFVNGFINLNQTNRQAEFLYSHAFAAANAIAAAQNNGQSLRTSSNTVTNNQSTTSLAQQS